MLKVNEIFHSIQGESSFAGRPCVFIRLSGCNLRCSYCDTTYAYDKGRMMEIDKIIEAVSPYGCSLICVTGGEPLHQERTPLLINRLLDSEWDVLLETNGSLDINRVNDRCVRIVDIKCPSSGMADRNDFANLNRLKPKDELKFVIRDEGDYNYAREILKGFGPGRHGIRVNFSPVFGELAAVDLAGYILRDHLDVRLNLQLHKIIWGPDKRGV